MKVVVDRVVQYANRYKLTNAETGEVLGTYDFEEVTGAVQEEGTEINKELFDSIQADLNNKLDKVTTPHVTRRAYIVDADGVTQGVLDIQVADIGNTLVMRGQDGSVLVSTLTDASDNRSATPKKYVDGKYDDTVHISEQTLSEAEQEQALENLNVPNTYAKQNGTYSNLRAGYASMDGNGNTITEFYATKTELAEEAATRAAADTALGGRIDDIVDGTTPVAKAIDADSATKATQDGNGNVITDTYATKAVATQTSDGLMSAEDKVALDTLADTVDFDTIVRYTEQTGITEEQQTQAQENIGLPAQSAISRYNLGAFDTYVDNGDGTATITRATYYLKIDGTETPTIESNRLYIARNDIRQYITIKGDDNAIGDIRVSQGVTMPPTQTYQGNANGVSYNNSATTLQIQISQDFMGQTLNTVEAAQKYFGENPLYIQLKLATSYTEDVISERPINTLDQQAMWSVREEWEKGLNVADIYFGGTTQYLGAYLIGNPAHALTPGETYTISLKTKNTGANFYFSEDISSAPHMQRIINANGNPFTLTFTVNDTYVFNNYNGNQLIKNAVDNSATNAAGDSLYDIMIVKGGVGYPYSPYHGGIIREDSTRLLRRTFIENNTSSGTMWYRVGSLPLSAIPGDYDSYSAIFLISSIYNENFGANAGGASSVIEFDVRKSKGNITNAPVSILGGNTPTNTLCSVITSSHVDLYIAVADLNNCKQITILSEATENKIDANIFVFNTVKDDWSTSAPSGAVYAVNRNTSSLEANGGTINGNVNATGTVSEQGQRVYSPNNPPPASDTALYQHTITLSKRMTENGSICCITFAILSKKTGFLGYGLDIIFNLIEETCIFPASGNYPGDTVVNQMCGIVHSVTAVKAGSYLQINYIKYDPTTANAQFPDEYTVNITDDDGFSVTDRVIQIC